MSWLEHTDEEYNRMHKKWEYTQLVSTVEYTDQKHIKEFLPKRAHWEKDPAHLLRINSADPNMDFNLLMGKIVGQAHSTEDDDTRMFEKDGVVGLGNPDDKNTPIGKIWHNADGEGTSYPVLWRKYARKQLVYQTMYVLVDGLEDEVMYDTDGIEIGRKSHEARIKMIDPTLVLDKDNSGGLPEWIKVKHRASTGMRSWSDEQKEVDYYTIYHLDGWARYRMSDDNKTEEIVAEGSYEFYTDTDRTQRCLPIFRVTLPFDTYIGHYIARKSVNIFQLESMRDSYVANADIHFVDEGSPVEYEARKDDIQAGETHHNIEKGTKAYYISPPSDPAELATEVIDKKRKNLYEAAYQQYGDAAKEATATEIKQEARSGIESFLRLYVTTLDEGENRAVFLLEQVYFPNDTSKWNAHKIERSKKFAILDPIQFVTLVMDIVFGDKALPLTDDMVMDAVKFVWTKHLGFSIGDTQEKPLMDAVKLFLDEKHGSSRERILPTGDGQATAVPELQFEEL